MQVGSRGILGTVQLSAVGAAGYRLLNLAHFSVFGTLALLARHIPFQGFCTCCSPAWNALSPGVHTALPYPPLPKSFIRRLLTVRPWIDTPFKIAFSTDILCPLSWLYFSPQQISLSNVLFICIFILLYVSAARMQVS